MIKNYFKIAWRNIIKDRIHSFINIAGLSVGMAVGILIGLWIYTEFSFNKDNKNYGRVARVVQNVTNNGSVNTWFVNPFPLAQELRKKYSSDFKYIVTGTPAWNHILTVGDKKLSKTGPYLESEAPDLFDLKMISGSRNGLKDPSSILISQSVAMSFFGNSNPLDKLIKIDNNSSVKVTGVYRDLPESSSFADVTFIAPWQLFANNIKLNEMKNLWGIDAFTIYAQVAENADMQKVSARIKDAKLNNVDKSGLSQKPQVFLFPMSKWHLYAKFENGINAGGRIQYVWLFGMIGCFVLFLACINFMNLSTARSEKRAKEVGIRKAMGSLRAQLIYQFFSESMLMVAFSFVAALILAQLALPFFNQVAGKNMSILWGSPLFWLMSACFSVLTALMAGSYPALYLSSFKAVKALKGTFKAGRFAAAPRKALVVLQFAVSVTLIIGTIVVLQQIQFAKKRPVGYSRDGLVMLHMSTRDVYNHFAAFKDELLKTGAVSSVAESESTATSINGSNGGFDWPGKDPALTVDFPTTAISQEFGKTVGWQFSGGRDFSNAFVSDSAGFIINQAAVKYMGLKHPVGETIRWNKAPYKIIGVTNDMVQESPYEPVRPSFFYLSKSNFNYVIVKINPLVSTSLALGKMEKVFQTFNPAQPFEYQFADDEYAKKFGNEELIGKLAGFFSALAIFISCMGLFGMASFMAGQRIKEIGIRKVLGASVFTLWGMLSKDFILLVTISLFISVPTSAYFMHNWLQSYQYRSALSWFTFVEAGVGVLVITLLTISYQSIKASLANPVKSLRSE